MKSKKNYYRRVNIYSLKHEPIIYTYHSGIPLKLANGFRCLSKDDLRHLLFKLGCEKVAKSFLELCMKNRTRSELFLLLCKLIDPFYCSCYSDEMIINEFYVVVVYDDTIKYYITPYPDKYVYL